MKEDVLKEIALIMEVESVDTTTQGWFPHRTTAAKNLIDKMTEAERGLLREKGDKMGSEGLPESVQRK
jgi:hypothetical protein